MFEIDFQTRNFLKLYLRFQINSKGFSRDRSFWHEAWNLWSLFPPIKLSELSPDEQDERVNLFLLGMAIRVVEFSNGGYKIRKIFA